MANVHPKVVQERLGHSSITTTVDTYSHVMPGIQDEAAACARLLASAAKRKGSNPVARGRISL